MRFNIGQKVVFLHEVGGGCVRSIDEKGRYVIEDEDGFLRPCLPSQIGPVYGDPMVEEADFCDRDEIEAIFSKLEIDSRKEVLPDKSSSVDVWEIDLHAEKIMDATAQLNSANILYRQMATFQMFFNKACRKRIRKFTVIHGVGEGVLKYEIRNFLAKKEGVRYYDADYKMYGKGATTVELMYY